MKIIDTAVKRPIFIFMLFLSLIVVGLIGYARLPIDLMPDVEIPVIVITIQYPGAGSEEIEKVIAKPVEDALSNISGRDSMTSYCMENVVMIVIQFVLGTDLKDSELKIRSNIQSIRNNLPDDMKEPAIVRIDFQALPPVMLNVTGPKDMSVNQLRYIASEVIKRDLQKIDGVADIIITGGQDRELKVDVNKSQLDSLGISLPQIIQALQNDNYSLPSGNMNKETIEIPIRVLGEFKTGEDIGEVVVAYNSDNRPIKLKEIATITDSFVQKRTISRTGGVTPSVFMTVQKQSKTNVVEIAKNVLKRTVELNKELSDGIKIEPVIDNSKFIKDSIDSTIETLIEGAIFAVIIVFLFLWNMRSTIVTALALPNSVIGAFFFIMILGFTKNVLTMLALSLSIGLLIDDAIVVRENIFRHLEEGKTAKEAALFGTKQVSMAVLATSCVIISVFLPVAFMGGIVGQFFRQFGLTVVAAVCISTLDAFTMAPMLSTTILKKYVPKAERKKNIFFYCEQIWENAFDIVKKVYLKILHAALKHKLIVFVIMISTFIFTMFLFTKTGFMFMSSDDRDEFGIFIDTQPGSSLEESDALVKHVEKVVEKFDFVKNYFTTIGAETGDINLGDIKVSLKPRGNDRPFGLMEAQDKVREAILKENIPGIKFYLGQVSSMSGQSRNIQGYKVVVSLTGPDLDTLYSLGQKMYKILKAIPGTIEVDTTFKVPRPEVQIELDKRKIAELGAVPYTITTAIRMNVDGYVASKFKEGGKEYDIRVKLADVDKNDLEKIRNIQIPIRTGKSVALREIANVEVKAGTSRINRKDRERQVYIICNLEQGISQSEIMTVFSKNVAQELSLPSGYNYTFEGQLKSLKELQENILIAFILAFVFIYMVLASLYESFIHPFTIILSIPLAFIGALIALQIAGKQLEMVSLIGIILLMGLVAKNGILLVDYTNQLRSEGMTREEALLAAGPVRLRPILMTSLAMIAGMIPIALALGVGGTAYQGMAIVVIGGLITSTFLTLVILPVVYVIMDSIKHSFMKKEECHYIPDTDYPTLWRRFACFIIDVIIYFYFAQLGTKLLADVPQAGMIIVVILLILNEVVLVSLTGKTIGKFLLMISVRNTDGSKLSFAKAFLRLIIKVPSTLIFFAGQLASVWNHERQTLYDRIVKSIVIQKHKNQ